MTNQPAEGTFSRLMATTAPMKEKHREEQEKATRPPVVPVTTPVLETPHSQKGKNQRMKMVLAYVFPYLEWQPRYFSGIVQIRNTSGAVLRKDR